MSTETHQTSPLAGPVRFLCGIGGSGMSPLAQVLRHRGERIRGSHRSFDRGQNARISQGLREQGIEIWPQDGSGVSGSCEVVASSAVGLHKKVMWFPLRVFSE